MFRFEKEMIPVIKDHLSQKYQTNYFVDEFDSGNGIADIVFTTNMEERNKLILDYELIYTVLNDLNKINKKIELKKFYKNSFLSKKRVLALMDLLLDIGILKQIDNDVFIIKNKYSPPVKKMISIEAKLCNWKSGFYQALRYKTFAHKTYLAISDRFLHRVNLELLKRNNVGLISVSPQKIKFIFKVKTEKPHNQVAYAYLAEKFYNAFI